MQEEFLIDVINAFFDVADLVVAENPCQIEVIKSTIRKFCCTLYPPINGFCALQLNNSKFTSIRTILCSTYLKKIINGYNDYKHGKRIPYPALTSDALLTAMQDVSENPLFIGAIDRQSSQEKSFLTLMETLKIDAQCESRRERFTSSSSEGGVRPKTTMQAPVRRTNPDGESMQQPSQDEMRAAINDALDESELNLDKTGSMTYYQRKRFAKTVRESLGVPVSLVTPIFDPSTDFNSNALSLLINGKRVTVNNVISSGRVHTAMSTQTFREKQNEKYEYDSDMYTKIMKLSCTERVSLYCDCFKFVLKEEEDAIKNLLDQEFARGEHVRLTTLDGEWNKSTVYCALCILENDLKEWEKEVNKAKDSNDGDIRKKIQSAKEKISQNRCDIENDRFVIPGDSLLWRYCQEKRLRVFSQST